MSFGSASSSAAQLSRNMQIILYYTQLKVRLVVHRSLHAGRSRAQALPFVNFRARTLLSQRDVCKRRDCHLWVQLAGWAFPV